MKVVVLIQGDESPICDLDKYAEYRTRIDYQPTLWGALLMWWQGIVVEVEPVVEAEPLDSHATLDT